MGERRWAVKHLTDSGHLRRRTPSIEALRTNIRERVYLNASLVASAGACFHRLPEMHRLIPTVVEWIPSLGPGDPAPDWEDPG